MKTGHTRTSLLVARHEIRVLMADRSLPLACGLLVMMIAYAFHNGLGETRIRDQAAAAVQKSEHATARHNIETLRRIDEGTQQPGPFANPANPATIGSGGAGRYAVIPTAALAPLAIGQSDMSPDYYAISYGSKTQFMHASEIENPWKLLNGHFDLAFVMVFLLPLLIFALTYNLLSSEREAGTLRMLLSQPLALVVLILSKLAARAVFLLVCAVVLPVLLLLLFRPESRQADQLVVILLWAAAVVAYGAIWFALAFAVNSLGRSSAANALILIASWALVVLVAPVLLNLAIGLAEPAPSRTELATRTRVIESENLRRYDDLFHGDYRYIDDPQALLAKNGRIEMPPRIRAFFLADRDMDAQIDDLLRRFDQQLDAQQRLVDRFGVLSPAVVANEAFTLLAGTGSRRYLDFKRQVDDFHGEWRAYFYPRVLEGVAMREDDLENLPRWHWREPPARTVAADALQRILLLGLASIVLFAAGIVRLRRHVFV